MNPHRAFSHLKSTDYLLQIWIDGDTSLRHNEWKHDLIPLIEDRSIMSVGLKILGIYFLDVVVTFSLFIAACMAGSAAHQLLTPGWNFLFMPLTVIALLPAAFYVRWREKMTFDGWDILVFGTLLSGMGLFGVSESLFATELFAILQSAVFVLGTYAWESFRKAKFPRAKQSLKTR